MRVPGHGHASTGGGRGQATAGPGPRVPHVCEEFTLSERGGATTLGYAGELGADFGAAGQRWAGKVAAAWEAARASFISIKNEAERRCVQHSG